MLQDQGSDHLSIFLSVPLSSVFRPNERLSSFNFQKARWDDFASYFDSHCPSAKEYSSLSISSATALFISLVLNASKSSIPFSRIKHYPRAWWSAKVEGAFGERHKAFAAAHRSDEDCQAYISSSRRTSSVIAKAKAEAWQISIEELVFPRHARCVLSRLRCNGHSLVLGSYLSSIGRIENPCCSACGHSSRTPLNSLCTVQLRTLRRSLFVYSLPLYDLWSRPLGVGRLLGLHGLPPCPHPSEGVG